MHQEERIANYAKNKSTSSSERLDCTKIQYQ